MRIQNTIDFFSDRRRMWTGIIEGLDEPLERWREAARTETKSFKSLEESASVLGQLTKMAIDERMEFAPSVRLDAYGELNLAARIEARNTLRDQLENPLGNVQFTEYQEKLSGKMWDKHKTAIQNGDAEKALKALDRNFTFRKYWYAFSNPQRYKEITQLEHHMQHARSQLGKHAKAYKAAAGMDVSINAEQKEVAKSLAKMAKKDRIKNMLEIIGPKKIGDDPVLQTLSNIMEECPSMKEKDIFEYLQENDIGIAHPTIFASINNANNEIKDKIKEGKKSLSLAEQRRDAICRFQKKLRHLVRRETEMHMDGKYHPIQDLLQAMEDGTLEDKEKLERLSERVRHVSDTWAMDSTVDIIKAAAEVMASPDFDIEDLPEKRLDHAIRIQHISYMGMRTREGLKSVSDWTRHASKRFMEQAQKTMLSAKEMLRAPILGVILGNTDLNGENIKRRRHQDDKDPGFYERGASDDYADAVNGGDLAAKNVAYQSGTTGTGDAGQSEATDEPIPQG
jgi:hypothetical protein